MNAFHVLGGLLVVWAVLVGVLGITRENFPGSRAAERGVGAISVVLVLGAVSSAVITSALEDEEKGEEAKAEESSATKGQQLGVSAPPGGQLRFDKNRLSARHGPVTLTLANGASIRHNVSIEGNGLDKEGPTVGKGGTSRISADLRPGRYVFYCSVPGHRQGGMEGQLQVE